MQTLTDLPLESIATYRFREGVVAGVPCIVSRTGYTGEDGFELYCPPDRAEHLWNALLEAGQPAGLVPAGLGARDTLRTEMKYALYGNDIDDAHTPLEAGLGWIVKLDKGEFVGRAALAEQKAAGVRRKLVGFEMREPGIPRHGYFLLKDGQRVGEVTSGTQGPTVKKAIGIGYVPGRARARGHAAARSTSAAVPVSARGGEDPVQALGAFPGALEEGTQTTMADNPKNLRYTKDHEWARRRRRRRGGGGHRSCAGGAGGRGVRRAPEGGRRRGCRKPVRGGGVHEGGERAVRSHLREGDQGEHRARRRAVHHQQRPVRSWVDRRGRRPPTRPSWTG